MEVACEILLLNHNPKTRIEIFGSGKTAQTECEAESLCLLNNLNVNKLNIMLN
jgi:hypothetical protein